MLTKGFNRRYRDSLKFVGYKGAMRDLSTIILVSVSTILFLAVVEYALGSLVSMGVGAALLCAVAAIRFWRR